MDQEIGLLFRLEADVNPVAMAFLGKINMTKSQRFQICDKMMIRWYLMFSSSDSMINLVSENIKKKNSILRSKLGM